MSQQHSASSPIEDLNRPPLRLVHQAENSSQVRGIRRLRRAAITLAIATLAAAAYTWGWSFVHIFVEAVLIIIALGLAGLITILMIQIFKESDR